MGSRQTELWNLVVARYPLGGGNPITACASYSRGAGYHWDSAPVDVVMLEAGLVLEIYDRFGLYVVLSQSWDNCFEALTLQQAQNFQQSSSSSPRSRMRKTSSGMSQRKFPGGHSVSDSNVTPGVCREGLGRQGQRGKAGLQLSEGWSSLVKHSLNVHNEKCCSGRTLGTLCSTSPSSQRTCA